jgi:hypothetical protein
MSNARSAAGLVLWQTSRAYAREVYMPNFRLYLLDENDNIKAFEIVECPADAEAASVAEKLLAKYWNFCSVIQGGSAQLKLHPPTSCADEAGE